MLIVVSSSFSGCKEIRKGERFDSWPLLMNMKFLMLVLDPTTI